MMYIPQFTAIQHLDLYILEEVLYKFTRKKVHTRFMEALCKTEGNNPLSDTEDFSEAAQSNQVGLTHLIRTGRKL